MFQFNPEPNLIGRRWDVCSRKVRAWTPAAVVDQQNSRAILKYDHFPENLTVDLDILLLERSLFRPLGETGK